MIRNSASRTFWAFALITLCILFVSGCAPSGPTEEEYQSAITRYQTAENNLQTANQQISDLQKQVAALTDENTKVKQTTTSAITLSTVPAPTPTPIPAITTILTTAAPPTPTPTPKPSVEISYSWKRDKPSWNNVEYTLVSINLKNQSDYNVDVTFRVKAFDSQGVTVYDDSGIIQDIYRGETCLRLWNAGTAMPSNVTADIVDVIKTTIVTPSIAQAFVITGSSTGVVIDRNTPIIVAKEGDFYIDIRNNTSVKSGLRLEVRQYDSVGQLENVYITSLGSVESSETKRFLAGYFLPEYHYNLLLVE